VTSEDSNLTESRMDALTTHADARMLEALHRVLDIDVGRTAVHADAAARRQGDELEMSKQGIALDVIARVAPAELSLFQAFSDADANGLQGTSARRGRSDKVLRFGIPDAVALVTPVVLIVANEIVRYFTEEAAKASTTRLQRFLRRRRHAPSQTAEPDDEGNSLLTPAHEAEVRRIVLEAANRSELSEERAEELADAVIDALTDMED
jgi:hypothetical protein